MAFKATEIRLDPETRSKLEGWVRASSTEQRYVRQARIALRAADGMASRAIAREVGVITGIVSIWRKSITAAGIDGLRDKPRSGAKRVYCDATDKRILTMLDQPAPKGRARWDGKLLAKELGDVNYVRSLTLSNERSAGPCPAHCWLFLGGSSCRKPARGPAFLRQGSKPEGPRLPSMAFTLLGQARLARAWSRPAWHHWGRGDAQKASRQSCANWDHGVMAQMRVAFPWWVGTLSVAAGIDPPD